MQQSVVSKVWKFPTKLKSVEDSTTLCGILISKGSWLANVTCPCVQCLEYFLVTQAGLIFRLLTIQCLMRSLLSFGRVYH